jgi:UrcA family protein
MTMNRTTTVSRFLTVIAAALVGAVASGFAALPAAADSSDLAEITVKFGDLNISNPQGATALYARIGFAAKSVCSRFDGPGATDKMRRDECINKAISKAVTKVNSSALSAVYSAKTGKQVPIRLVSSSK